MENVELTPTARAIFGLPSPKARPGGEILRTAQRSIEAFRGNGRLHSRLRLPDGPGLIRTMGKAESPRSWRRWEITDEGRAVPGTPGRAGDRRTDDRDGQGGNGPGGDGPRDAEGGK